MIDDFDKRDATNDRKQSSIYVETNIWIFELARKNDFILIRHNNLLHIAQACRSVGSWDSGCIREIHVCFVSSNRLHRLRISYK